MNIRIELESFLCNYILRNLFKWDDKDETHKIQNLFALLSLGKYTL